MRSVRRFLHEAIRRSSQLLGSQEANAPPARKVPGRFDPQGKLTTELSEDSDWKKRRMIKEAFKVSRMPHSVSLPADFDHLIACVESIRFVTIDLEFALRNDGPAHLTERDAFGYDEYHPLTHRGQNLSGPGIGYMIVDSLDTIMLMRDTSDKEISKMYERAHDWVKNSLDFSGAGKVNTFEVCTPRTRVKMYL